MKKLFTFLILIIAALVLCACSVRKEASIKEVTFWTLQMGDYADYMYKVIRAYEKENPNVQIKWIDVPFFLF